MEYNELEIRRLMIDDEQWKRTSPSWKRLKPNRNFDHFDENDETISEYCERIQNVIIVPEQVGEQWLYYHYYNENSVDNYGWIDYERATFEYSTITTEEAVSLKVISEYSAYVQSKKMLTPFNSFACTDQDREYWIQARTWRVPPVIVDVQSFPNPQPHADFSGSYQLIEGHSRLGYLLSMHRSGERLKEEHQVYILKTKENA